ncbi:hypothetical protein D0Z07_3941 [Hyphodiscus hymeniophilus]|uniref:Uncharacterized protein n=1 Tax=Hyphodiscus hymeniophilus TaxID=353542 RepID=A0A9P6VL94_9HELO|nr:hypothetical protein D0Z07_3941 [Hyphodiscus hymeniophilus]
MSTSTGFPSSAALGIENTNIITTPGITLDDKQKLFAGKPTLQKLQLWADDATFADPITKAQGRKQYQAQWYGLVAAFSSITPHSHSVTSAGNPITMDLKTTYKVKGLGTEKTIESVIKITTDASGEKITSVEDRWNGNIPEGPVTTAFRNLNSVVVPAFVGVPKNDEDDAKKTL